MSSNIAQKIDALRAYSPHAVELAMYAALAAQIEPELLRALRLELVPDADAGCEADIWFSSLVQSSEPSGIVFSAEAVSALRSEFFKSDLAPNLKRAFEIIERVHANGPSALKVEEKLTYYALSDEPDKYIKIQNELKSIAVTMEDPSRSRHLARWAVRALPRLPDDALKTPAASLLAVGASGLLNGRQIAAAGTSVQASSDDWRVLTRILAQNIPYQTIYARLTRQGVEFSAENFAGGLPISVPRTDPLQLQVEWMEDNAPISRSITFALTELALCETTANEVTLRTILGDWFTLKLEKYDLFISCVPADQEWVTGVLLPPLRQAGVHVITPSDFSSGAPLALNYERALKASRRIAVVLSRAYAQNASAEFLTELVFSPYTENPELLPIPLLREDVKLPTRLQMLNALDMRDPARFNGELQRLLRALGVTMVETSEQKITVPKIEDTRTVSGHLNFDLRLVRVEKRYQARVVSPRGTAQNEFEMPFHAEELEKFWQGITRGNRKARNRSVREFGGRLFETVFANQVRGFFFNSLASARNQNMGLRIRFDLQDVPELANLPWELLYEASTERFYALSNETPIIRFVNLPGPTPPLRVSQPLRMLVMIAEAHRSIPIDGQRKWIELQDALKSLIEQGKLVLEILERVTLERLQFALRQNEYHIMHLIGQVGGEGAILLEHENRGVNRVRGETLGRIFGEHPSLRLVRLNLSQFATDPVGEPSGNFARALVQQGITAVVNTEFPISDAANVALVRELYSGLTENIPIDLAITQARKAIYLEENEIEWASPVLYTRTTDSVIFDIQSETIVVKEQEQVSDVHQSQPIDEEADILSFSLNFRSEITSKVFSLLRKGNSCNLVSTGNSGMGSFASHLRRFDVQERYLQEDIPYTLFVYLRGESFATQSPSELYIRIFERLIDMTSQRIEYQEQSSAIRSLYQEITTNPELLGWRNLDRAFTILFSAGPAKIVLILDHCDSLIARAPSSLLRDLRALRDSHKLRMAYIVMTQQRLLLLRSSTPEVEDFFELFVTPQATLFLPPYNEADSLDVIRRLGSRLNPPRSLSDSDAKRLHELCAGHAGLVSAAFSAWVNQGVTSEPPTLSLLADDSGIKNECEKIWRSLEEQEQDTLIHLRDHGESKNPALTQLANRSLVQISLDKDVEIASPLFEHYILQLQGSVTESEIAQYSMHRLDSMPPRALSVWIEYTGKEFRINLLHASGTVSAKLPITREELERIILNARRALDEIVNWRDKDGLPYQAEIDIDAMVNRTTLTKLAEAGFHLYREIFQHPKMDAQGRVVSNLLQEVAQGESVYIQIISREMVLPWNMLYVTERYDSEKVHPELFLGLKHVVAQLPFQPNKNFTNEIRADPQLVVGLNLNREIDLQTTFPLVRNQEIYWADQARRNPIMLITRTSGRAVQEALADPNTPDQIMYLFGHIVSRNLGEGPNIPTLQLGVNSIVTLEDSILSAPPDIRLAGSPLVFLNACESAELSPFLYSGFMPYFIEKGARGMIGTEATVPALFAADYAAKFFDQFLAGKPLGEVMLDLRREYFFNHKNILGLLYSLYADADTRIVWNTPPIEQSAA